MMAVASLCSARAKKVSFSAKVRSPGCARSAGAKRFSTAPPSPTTSPWRYLAISDAVGILFEADYKHPQVQFNPYFQNASQPDGVPGGFKFNRVQYAIRVFRFCGEPTGGR